MDLFDQQRNQILSRSAPLADRMRPRTLEEFIGQEHILGPGRLLRRAIQIDQLSSLIFYGPPGTGKTTLARIIANTTKAQFISINAVLAGVKEIRDAIEQAQKSLSLYGRRTILFVDEVHRFNKSQQDALLPHVENGVLTLIGATTENPYFEVNKALVSRSRIFQLKKLDADDLKRVALQALSNEERGYGLKTVRVDDDALDHLVKVANGDARGVLNALELAVETTSPQPDGVIHIDRTIAEESIQQKAVLYDKDGDAHYDTISAFIKSVRGSDPDAALYWMSKMIYAGEDPRFIFRRMMILACEDVGLADPNALSVVVSASQAFDYIGLPEGRFHLAHACLYLATAPKSNSSMGFFDALNTVTQQTEAEVPDHLKDASRDGDGFGHGKGYLYPHAYRDHWVAQQYLPSSMQGKLFYQPSDRGYEKQIKVRVERLREAMIEAMEEREAADPFVRATATSGAQQWVRRATSETMLAEVRDRLFEIADVKRDSLLLDLNGRTGLLALEAGRRIVEGSVWVLAHTRADFETLGGVMRRFDEPGRPQIVRTSWPSFDADLKTAAGGDVRFSIILGRNILTREADKAALLRRIIVLLAKGGILALAESIPSRGQRIAELLTFPGKRSAMGKKFKEAEESLFGDADDPMVNWDADSLAANLDSIAGIAHKSHATTHRSLRRILPPDIDFWLRRAESGGRRSLGDRLRESLGEEQIQELASLMHGQLDNRDVRWKTEILFTRIIG
jgi:putative ATPase